MGSCHTTIAASEAHFSKWCGGWFTAVPVGLDQLFAVRSRVLAGRMPAEATAAYLSGVLIGEELRAGLAGLAADAELTIVGAGGLVDRYLAALAVCGVTAQPAPDAAVARGHFEIAKQAGLLT